MDPWRSDFWVPRRFLRPELLVELFQHGDGIGSCLLNRLNIGVSVRKYQLWHRTKGEEQEEEELRARPCLFIWRLRSEV
jgi:hypothetical protein